MRTARTIGLTALIVRSGLGLYVANAQQVGVKRTDLQQHDLSIPGREVVQAIVEIAPGVTAAKHWHPGEEIIHVLEGSLGYQLEDKPPVTLEVGVSLRFTPTLPCRTAG
jgi:quercetin dioxygenase-like cupin family protein